MVRLPVAAGRAVVLVETAVNRERKRKHARRVLDRSEKQLRRVERKRRKQERKRQDPKL